MQYSLFVVFLLDFIILMLLQVSANVGHKTLFLYNINDPENPIELAFQPRYGTIVSYKWLVTCHMFCSFHLKGITFD